MATIDEIVRGGGGGGSKMEKKEKEKMKMKEIMEILCCPPVNGAIQWRENTFHFYLFEKQLPTSPPKNVRGKRAKSEWACMCTSNSTDEQEAVVGVAMRFIKKPRLKLIREESCHSCLCF